MIHLKTIDSRNHVSDATIHSSSPKISFQTVYKDENAFPAYNTTSLQLTNAIIKAHCLSNNKPSKHFLSNHSNNLAKLPMTTFTSYATVTFHVDGGANVNGIIDKNLFYFYLPCPTNIVQVGGSGLHSPGWGGVIIRNGTSAQLIAPVYYFPHNPQNTIATPSLLHYGNCSEVIVNTNKMMTFRNNSIENTFELHVNNDLDNVCFEILQFKQTKSIIASANMPRRSSRIANIAKSTCLNKHPQTIVPPRRLPRLTIEKNNDIPHPKPKVHVPVLPNPGESTHATDTPIQPHSGTSTFPQSFDVYNDNGTYVVSLPRHVMSIIATFSVLLQPNDSPRALAIQAMNSVMGNYFNSSEQKNDMRRKKTLIQLNHQILTSDPTLLVPVMAKLNRATRKETSSFYDWTQMHLSLLHASPTTMDIMIRKNMLADIPTSLAKKHKFDCYCHICALRKSTKLRRGPPVNKSHLTPFTFPGSQPSEPPKTKTKIQYKIVQETYVDKNKKV